MKFPKKLRHIILIHALIFLAASAVLLVWPEESESERLLSFAVLLLVAGLIQVLMFVSRARKGNVHYWLLAASAIDLGLGGLLLYTPDESLKYYLVILSFWSGLSGCLLLYRSLRDSSGRSVLMAAALAFLTASVYMGWYIPNPDAISIILLGIVGALFSIFLGAFAFRSGGREKEKENGKTDDGLGERETEDKGENP